MLEKIMIKLGHTHTQCGCCWLEFTLLVFSNDKVGKCQMRKLRSPGAFKRDSPTPHQHIPKFSIAAAGSVADILW